MASIEILGILSALLTLSVYIANQYHRLSADSVWYDFANVLASIGLFYYAYVQDVVPFMMTNIVWGGVAGIDVLKYLLKWKGLKRRRK